ILADYSDFVDLFPANRRQIRCSIRVSSSKSGQFDQKPILVQFDVTRPFQAVQCTACAGKPMSQ
ncbi:MAG TPA: hypothetical protein VHD56_12930, partial [Tepidisphaeraceae bacterium]|nr:hypothetical protein [Tepidisphaeraceae bacterium]